MSNHEEAYTVKTMWNFPFFLMNTVNILSNISFSILMTTISMYAVELGASLSLAGTIASIFSFAALLMRPFGGYLFDRFNKRNVFVVGTFFFGMITLGYVITSQIPLLFALRILHGVFFSIYSTSSMALFSLFVPKDRTSEGLGYYYVGLLASQAIGPALAGPLKDALGFYGMYILVAFAIALPPLMTFLIRVPASVLAPVKKPGQRSTAPFSLRQLIAGEYLIYAVVVAVINFHSGATNAFMLMIGQERGIANVSLFFTVASVCILLIRLFGGRITDRSPLIKVVGWSLAATALSMICTGAARGLFLICAAALFKSIGQGFGQVALQGDAIRSAGAGRVGIVTATIYMGCDIGNTLGPAVGGAVADRVGYAGMFYLCTILVVLAFLAFSVSQRRKQQAPSPLPHP